MTRCPIPTEHAEQVALMQWAKLQARRMPGLELLHAIPNGGTSCSHQTGAMRKAEGLQSGVPDLCLPVPMHGKHGAHVEMKRQDRVKSKPTAEQLWWLATLQDQGYACALCYGAGQAIEFLQAYYRDGGPKVDFWAMWEAEKAKPPRKRRPKSRVSRRQYPIIETIATEGTCRA